MNTLAIDFGLKRIGVAYSVSGIISTLPMLKNDDLVWISIKKLLKDYQIDCVYVGLSERDPLKTKTLSFVEKLSEMIELPVETVEESVSTIEAKDIFISNKGKRKSLRKDIDSIAAAVILRRVIS